MVVVSYGVCVYLLFCRWLMVIVSFCVVVSLVLGSDVFGMMKC